MSINVESGVMQSIVTKAILEGIGTEARDLVLEQAVQYLTIPPKKRNFYDSEPETHLQAAFNEAVGVAVRQTAHDLVRDNEALQQRIRELIEQAVKAVLQESDSTLPDAIRKAVGDVISSYRPDNY